MNSLTEIDNNNLNKELNQEINSASCPQKFIISTLKDLIEIPRKPRKNKKISINLTS